MRTIAFLIYGVISTVLAGTAIIVVTSIPGLFDRGMNIIPWAVVASFVAAAPISWLIARLVEAQAHHA